MIDSIAFTLPAGWNVEALPADTTFNNKIGSCTVSFIKAEGALRARRQFKLNSPLWRTEDYALVKKLFEARQAFNTLTVVIKQG